MKIEDYGDWTIIKYEDDSIEYRQGLHSIPEGFHFFKYWKQYKNGVFVEIIDHEQGVFIGRAKPLGKPGPRKEIELRNGIK